MNYVENLDKNLFDGYDTKEGLGNIQKYNKCEELNTKHYLLNDFINIIERKGYEWEILKHEKAEKVEKYDYTTRKQGISQAEILLNADKSLNSREYKELIQKQKDGLLTAKETYILDKYFMSKKFKIDMEKIDSKFVDEHFRKEHIIDNYKKMNDGKKILYLKWNLVVRWWSSFFYVPTDVPTVLQYSSVVHVQ